MTEEEEEILVLREHYLIPLLSDYGFKVSFATDSAFSRRAVQLLAHFDKPIDRLEFLRNEIEPMTFKSRSGLYDVICRDEHKRVFIVEMQTGNYTYFKERVLFYIFQTYCGLIRQGVDAFKLLQSTYCICIVKDAITKGEDYAQKFLLQNEKGELFSTLIEIHLVELGKFPYLRSEHHKIDTDFKQLLYTMKYAHTFDMRDPTEGIPQFWVDTWLTPMLEKLHQGSLSPEQRVMLEVDILTMRMFTLEERERLEAAVEKASIALTKKVTKEVAEEVTEKVTEEVTGKVTEEVTEKVSKEVTAEVELKRIKKAILGGKISIEAIAEMFEKSIEAILAIKQSLENEINN